MAQSFGSGAYTYHVSWNGKEYSDGRRFITVCGVGGARNRQYTIIANKKGEILESKKASIELAEAAIRVLGWKEE